MRETNPILLRLWRNDSLESLHRGAWVMVDTSGSVIDGAGESDQLIFPRSATKSLQALPLVESGAFDHYGMDSKNLALALSSHSGESIHIEVATNGLHRIGLDESALRCGPQRRFGSASDAPATRITNTCSGKHVGFLAVSQSLGADPADYLDPAGEVQQLVAAAVAETTGVDPSQLGVATDGCSAPTFLMPLTGLATALARITNPAEFETARANACRRMTDAAAAHPELVAGSHERFCTDLIRVTEGRVFGKFGAEGIFSLGVVGSDVGFACKIDDGAERGFHAIVLHVLRRHDLISDAEVAALDCWGSPVLRNWDGLEVGRTEVVDTSSSSAL